MFPSTLLVVNSAGAASQIQALLKKIDQNFSPNNPDLFLVDEISGWGIDVIRKIRHFLSRKPFQHQNKVVLIMEAENLTPESQNSLLKILEEPGPNNYFLLVTGKPFSLLPTVSSRCQTIQPQSFASSASSQKLLTISPDLQKNLDISDRLSVDKKAVLPFLENQLILYHQQLLADSSPNTVNHIQKILKSIRLINQNVDPRSALDYFLLS
jgi:DNA polymerase III delta prime subunit